MNCHSKTKSMKASHGYTDRTYLVSDMRAEVLKKNITGFTLVETVVALIILAILSSGVLVVINRCIVSATNSTLRMHAFEVARENMEKLLALSSVKEAVDYGSSDKYPNVTWQTVVETFYEPLTDRMWVRAVCSSEYEDAQGQMQTIELTHWLTNVSKQQLMQILEQKQEAEEEFVVDDEVIETIEEAAEYAGVDVGTIEQWLDNGMLTTEDDAFIKTNLDLYWASDGKPSDEQKNLQIDSITDLLEETDQEYDLDEQDQSEEKNSDEIDPATGLTYEELENMDFDEIMELIKSRSK
jgi:prepilin-type N-terminal cleavage/methylation domain-containing protein